MYAEPLMGMMGKNRLLVAAAFVVGCLVTGQVFAQATDVGFPTFVSPHSKPIVKNGDFVFVANTPADTVDVIDANSFEVVGRVNVGVDPVSLAVRPDGSEVWVSNHVSDSISIIDIDAQSPTYLQIKTTLQAFDEGTSAPLIDEPMGIAFANNDKVYILFSSDNLLVAADADTGEATNVIDITAQDPRALAVHGDRLYVIPFESNNQSQISGCTGPLDGELCTFDALEHVVNNNNVLSLNAVVDIVKNPGMPDRDLFVFDTNTDELVQTVNTLGTLLYGLTVDSNGRVFIAQTDARNDANGKAGTANHGLAEMENRAFLNQITRVNCGGENCITEAFLDLEPTPPQHPAPGMALATPYGIQISDDDSTLVVTAAGSKKLFTVDPDTGNVLGRVDVGSVPRGIALESDAQGAPSRAWVLNAVDNTVSVVDFSSPSSMQVTSTVELADPTHPVTKRGRIAFNDANASTTGTFSCESCHPDNHTDQLSWVLETPICDVPGCTQIPPRITMPVRGLRDTEPYHWDGVPGDPYGGINTSSITASQPANCSVDEPESCTLFLVDGGLANTMCEVGNCGTNDEGKAGALSAADRDDLSHFILNVPYPPAPKRPFDNVMTDTAKQGFRVFHIDGVVRPNEGPNPNVCGACHRFPYLISTNSPGTGMDAPTWRGAYDRWLVLPQGRSNLADLLSPFQKANGIPERTMWVRDGPTFEPVWNMIIELDTGWSGTFGRMVTLNKDYAQLPITADLLEAMEVAHSEGGIVLQGEGVFISEGSATPIELEFDARRNGGVYFNVNDARQTWTRATLITRAFNEEFVGTLTARVGAKSDLDHPQPGIWTSSLHAQLGPVAFPTIANEQTRMEIRGRHIQEGAAVYVDGRRVAGDVQCITGDFPDCTSDRIQVDLAELPQPEGVHFLQVQNKHGLFSNDFIFHTSNSGTDNCPNIPNPDQADSDDDGTGDRCDDDAFNFQVNDGISGNWFDPEHDGEGWFVEILDESRALVYWFTQTPPAVGEEGSQAWIGGIGEIRGSSIVVDNASTEITEGPTFGPDFDPERVIRRKWGKFVLSFSSCSSGVMYYESRDLDFGSGSLDLARLTSISNLPCDDSIDPPIGSPSQGQVTAHMSGAWYDPSHDGEGWLLEILPDGRALAAWFSYDLDGKQAWFYNVGTVNGNTITFDLLRPAGTDFGITFDSEAMNFPPWGTVTFTFSDCNTATVTYDASVSNFGTGSLAATRLTQLSGLACPDS